VALTLLIVCATWIARAESGADEHMLAGAQHFRAGRYAEALVEFRVADRIGGDGGAVWYVAATLVKVNRPDDAVSEFARAASLAPQERDGLLDYYHALGCYEAKLYFCADRLLAAVGEHPGPRIAEQARKIRADLSLVTTRSSTTSTIDWYHARAQAALKAERRALAAAYYEEAVSLAALRQDRYRRDEATAAMARLRPKDESPRKSP
jgi:tetratricopeptide (TPR) repeat protein